MKINTGTILLEGLSFYAFHGATEEEQQVGSHFTLDVALHTNLSQATESDDLTQTINYASVYALIKEEMAIPSHLLEHAGGRIANRLFNEFSALQSLDLTLKKLAPPINGDCMAAGITLHCER